MKPSGAFVILLAGLGCGGAQSADRYVEPQVGPQSVDPEATEVRPSYGRAEIDKLLAEERRALADGRASIDALAAQRGKSLEHAVALADQAVRQRYVLALESCRDDGRWCPPALGLSWTFHDDAAEIPVSLDSELRFDLTSWRKLASELWARGCDCRTMRCVDGMTQAIDVLERRPTVEVQGDHDASAAITGARTCLWRLRGKAGGRGPAPAE